MNTRAARHERGKYHLVQALILSFGVMGVLIGVYFHEYLQPAKAVLWLLFIGSICLVLLITKSIKSALRFAQLSAEAEKPFSSSLVLRDTTAIEA